MPPQMRPKHTDSLVRARPHLLQALRHKVLEGQAPAVLVSQARRRVSGDHEDDPHGVHRPPRGSDLCHLDGADAQSPNIHLRPGSAQMREHAGDASWTSSRSVLQSHTSHLPASPLNDTDSTCTHHVQAASVQAVDSKHFHRYLQDRTGFVAAAFKWAADASTSLHLHSMAATCSHVSVHPSRNPQCGACSGCFAPCPVSVQRRPHLPVISALLDDLRRHPVGRANESVPLAHGVGQLSCHTKVCHLHLRRVRQ